MSRERKTAGPTRRRRCTSGSRSGSSSAGRSLAREPGRRRRTRSRKAGPSGSRAEPRGRSTASSTGGLAGRFCAHVQILELVPDGTDDVVLTLEPLDCVDDNPLALCAMVNGRYTGLAERQRWRFAGVSGPPDAPQSLTVSPVDEAERRRGAAGELRAEPAGHHLAGGAAGGGRRLDGGALVGPGRPRAGASRSRIAGVSHTDAYDVRAALGKTAATRLPASSAGRARGRRRARIRRRRRRRRGSRSRRTTTARR